jgi:hypothetical protein
MRQPVGGQLGHQGETQELAHEGPTLFSLSPTPEISQFFLLVIRRLKNADTPI